MSVELEAVWERVDGHDGCCCVFEARDDDEALLFLLGIRGLCLIASLEGDGVGFAHPGEDLERVEFPQEALVALRTLCTDGQRRGLGFIDELECFNVP